MSGPASRLLCAQTADPAATQALAAGVAACLEDGDLVVLTGDLGAGKTCFTQGLGAGLGVDEPITSPTFTLAAAYRGRLRLNHLDIYRLDDPRETIDLDLPELLEAGVTVIEWGERITSVLPAERLTVDLSFGPVGPDGSDDSLEPDDPLEPDDSDAGDDRRQLRFELAGDAWTERWPRLEAALAPWRAPC
jgi:tRNA threonylcarbamoyladenosine biosynthesis protein TsaE